MIVLIIDESADHFHDASINRLLCIEIWYLILRTASA